MAESVGSSAVEAVRSLLVSLLERSEREIEKGELTLLKPKDLLEAARMLIDLDAGDTQQEDRNHVGRDIIERLRLELGDENGKSEATGTEG